MFEFPLWLWIGWGSLSFVFLLTRGSGPLVFAWFLGQALICSTYTLGFLTRGNTLISVGVPAGIFLGWVAYQTQREWRQISKKE